jgi:hypothetical protein
MVTELDPGRFRDELRLTREILERHSGQMTIVFWAPQWSLSSAMPWAYEILHDEGYRYDSSCNPLPFLGNPAGPRIPYKVNVKGGYLWEIPPAGGMRVPARIYASKAMLQGTMSLGFVQAEFTARIRVTMPKWQ